MPKPVADWDEDDVLSLPSEGSQIERKGTLLLDLTLSEVQESRVLGAMAKQISAFANSGGGQLIYGINNSGQVDRGGISRIIKGRQSTKEWLEDILPALTEFAVVGINVYEILPRADGHSSIAKDKALYVIDVPDSEKAPHQSKQDWIYYVRLGSKSQPASHRMLEDIRNRARYPLIGSKLEIASMEIPFVHGQGINGDTNIRLSVTLIYRGKLKASNCCIRTEIVGSTARFVHWSQELVTLRNTAQSPQIAFWEFQYPLYPTMENTFWIVLRMPIKLAHSMLEGTSSKAEWVTESLTRLSQVQISWTMFADNAPPVSGISSLGDMQFETVARRWIQANPNAEAIYRYYGGSMCIP